MAGMSGTDLKLLAAFAFVCNQALLPLAAIAAGGSNFGAPGVIVPVNWELPPVLGGVTVTRGHRVAPTPVEVKVDAGTVGDETAALRMSIFQARDVLSAFEYADWVARVSDVERAEQMYRNGNDGKVSLEVLDGLKSQVAQLKDSLNRCLAAASARKAAQDAPGLLKGTPGENAAVTDSHKDGDGQKP